METYLQELKRICGMGRGADRKKALLESFDALQTTVAINQLRYDVEASNTITNVLTNFLVDTAVTDLQNRWSPLLAISQQFDPSAFSPLSPGIIKHVTSGPTAQTNPTNYEQGDATIAPITTTPNEYSVSWQVSNTDLNSGIRMNDLVTFSTANFANKVIEALNAVLIESNYGPRTIINAAAFGFSDLAALQDSLKKSPIKNIILDGSYIARVANQPGFFQKTGVLGGNPAAWSAYGWDTIAQSTDWTGATTNVRGFACNPQAAGSLWGQPNLPANIPGGILSSQVIRINGLEARILAEQWFNPATRTSWQSLRTIGSFSAVDKTAGFLIATG